MRTTIGTFIASIVIPLSASGAPQLLISTTISKHDAKGDTELLSKPSIIIESGNQGIIESGKREYIITPTLRDNGTVDIQTVITESRGKETATLSKPRMIVELGKIAQVRIGQLVFTAQPSISK